MELNDTRNVSLTSSLFRGSVLVDAIAENPDSHKSDVGNSSTFLMLFWQAQGTLARPSSKTLVESLYENTFQATITCNVEQLVFLSCR